MSVIIDLIILGIIAICIIMGYIKGLTGSLIKILSFVLSLIIAFVLFVPVSSFVINNTQIDENIEKSIRETVLSDEGEQKENQKMSSAITDYINQKVEEVSESAKEEIIDSTAKDVSQTIVKIGTWIALFLVARIALILLRFITSLVKNSGAFFSFAKLGGVIYGLIEGLIITYLALALISVISPMTEGKLSENINKSHIGSQMYNNNLLLNIIF